MNLDRIVNQLFDNRLTSRLEEIGVSDPVLTSVEMRQRFERKLKEKKGDDRKERHDESTL